MLENLMIPSYRAGLLFESSLSPYQSILLQSSNILLVSCPKAIGSILPLDARNPLCTPFINKQPYFCEPGFPRMGRIDIRVPNDLICHPRTASNGCLTLNMPIFAATRQLTFWVHSLNSACCHHHPLPEGGRTGLQ